MHYAALQQIMMTSEQASFLYSANADFIAELFERYAENPASVDPSWRELFTGLNDDARSMLQELRGASWAPSPHEPRDRQRA